MSTLKALFGHQQCSEFNGSVNFAKALINRSTITDESINYFFKDFQCVIQKEIDERNVKIRKLVESMQSDTSKITQYKDEHPLCQSKVCKQMYDDCKADETELMKLCKFSLLITPSMANVERGFSILTKILTELDKIMQLVLLGLQNFDDDTWEKLVDDYRDAKEHQITLQTIS